MAESNDRVVKDIRGRLKNIATKGGRYFSGTAKLFLASGSETVNIAMPAMGGMIETNKAILQDAAKFLRNPVDTINRSVDRATQSEGFKALQKFAHNALDDLKSGNLYDPERDRSEFGMSVDSLLDSFGDIDMSGFDDQGEYTEPADDSAFEKEVKLIESQEQAEDVRTGATIDAIGTATESVVHTVNANAQTDLRMSLKQHSQVMSVLENMVTQQAATLQAVSQTAVSTLEVTREAHQQLMSGIQTVTELLTKIESNTAPAQSEGIEPPKESELFGVHGELNIKEWLKTARKQADDKYGLSSALSMMTGGMDMKTMLELAGDNPLQLITDQIVGKLIPDYLKKSMDLTEKYMENFFPALLNKFAERGKRFEKGEDEGGGQLKDFLFGVLGVKSSSRSTIDVSTKVEKLSAEAAFTNRTAKAIEQVIPMWLSKIYSAISGDTLSMYDYTTGKLVSASKVFSDRTHSANDLVGRMGQSAYTFIKRGNAYKFQSAEQQEDFQNYLYKYLQDQAENGKFINPYVSDKEFKDNMAETDYKDFYSDLIKGILRSMPRNELLGLSSEINSARASRNRANFSINEELQNNGLGIVFSGMMDRGLESTLEAETKNKRYGLGDDDIRDLTTKHNEAIMRAGGTTKATNMILNDVLSTLQKGIITYTYILGNKDGSEDGNGGEGNLPPGFKAVQDAAEQAKARQERVEQDEKDRATRREEAKTYRQKEIERQMENREEGDVFLRRNETTADQALIFQRTRDIKYTGEDFTDNPETEQLRRMTQNTEGMLRRTRRKLADTFNFDPNDTVFDKIKQVADSPFRLVDLGLKTVDQFLFKIIYGEDIADFPLDPTDDEAHSLMKTVEATVRGSWRNARDWFSENIGEPLKKWLFGEDGILPKIKSGISDRVINPVKAKAKDLKDRAISKFIGTRDMETVEIDDPNNPGQKITVQRPVGDYKGGKFSNAVNRVTSKAKELKDRAAGKISPDSAPRSMSFIDKMLWGDEEGKLNRGRKTVDDYEYEGGVGGWNDQNSSFDSENYEDDGGLVYKGYHNEYKGFIGALKRAGDDFLDMMFGPDAARSDSDKWEADTHNSREKFNRVKEEMDKAFPNMVIGSGVGLLGSLFLPGGPIIGSILGAAGGLVAGSDTLKNYLFGETEDDHETTKYDWKTGKIVTVKGKGRKGGLINSEVQDGFKKFAPKMAIGAGVGALTSMFLPGGPIIGSILGSAGGMVAASDQLKQVLFGDGSSDDDGLISKSFREKIVNAVKEHAPGVIGGGAAGAKLGSMLGAGLGLIPGLSLLPTGPIFTLLGGITGAVSGDTIQEMLMGKVEETEEPDPEHPGKTKKVRKRTGGLFGKAYDYVQNNMFKPLGDKINAVGGHVKDWFKESVVTPLKTGVGPLKEQIGRAKTAIQDATKDIGTKIMEQFDSIFKGPRESMDNFFKDKIIDPMKKVTDKIFNTIGKTIGNILSAPFKAVEYIFNGTIGGKTMDEIRDERAEKRKTKREERRIKRQEKRHQDALESVERMKMRVMNFFGGGKKQPTEAEGSDGVTDETAPGQGTPPPVPSTPARKSVEEETAAMWEQYEKDNAAARGEPPTPEDESKPEERKPGGIRGWWRNLWDDQKKRDEEKARERAEKKERDRKQRDEIREKLKEEEEKKRAKKDADEAAAADDKVDSGDSSEPKEKKKDKDSGGGLFGRKSNNKYLKSIDKTTKKIFEEIRGQLGGTGWNIAYIKTLLDKHLNGGKELDGDELPEEMEGSKKVSKKRGFFGKMRDRVKDFIDDTLGETIDKVKGTIGRAVDVITSPIRAVGKALGWLGDAVVGAKDTIFGILKTLGAAAGDILKGFAHGVGDILAASGTIIREAASGIGSALGDTIAMVAGVLRDGVSAISGVVRGMVEVAADIAPDIAHTVWQGMKFVGRGALKGVKFVAKGVGKGAKWLFDKITGNDKDDEEGGEKVKVKRIGKVTVDGGFLDTVKESVPVAVGGSSNIPFPYVTVTNGLAKRVSGTAIPVYILGVDKAATFNVESDEDKDNKTDATDTGDESANRSGTPTPKSSDENGDTDQSEGDMAPSPTDKVKQTVADARKKIAEGTGALRERVSETADTIRNNASETIANAKERAADVATGARDKVKDYINEARQGFGEGAQFMTDLKDKVDGFIGSTRGAMDEIMNRYAGVDPNLSADVLERLKNGDLEGLNISDKAKKQLSKPGGSVLVSPDGHVMTGGEVMMDSAKNALSVFKKHYFGTDSKAETSTNPAEAYDDAIRGAQSMEEVNAIQVAQQMNTNNNVVAAGGGGEEKEKKGLLETILSLFGGGGGLLKTLGTVLGGTKLAKFLGGGKAIGSAAGKTVLGNLPFLLGTANAVRNGDTERVGLNVAKQTTSKILPWLSKSAAGATEILKTPSGEQAASKAATSIGAKLVAGFRTALEKLMNNKTVAAALAKVSPKLASNFSNILGTITKQFDKVVMSLAGESAQQLLKKANWVVLLATAAWDVVTGMARAGEYFQVSSTDATHGMRIAAGLAKGISGLAFGLIPVDWLASTIYNWVASEESKTQLKENQEKLRSATHAYNQANGTNLTYAEYSKKFNEDGSKRTILDKARNVGATVFENLTTPTWAIETGITKIGKFLGLVDKDADEARIHNGIASLIRGRHKPKDVDQTEEADVNVDESSETGTGSGRHGRKFYYALGSGPASPAEQSGDITEAAVTAPTVNRLIQNAMDSMVQRLTDTVGNVKGNLSDVGITSLSDVFRSPKNLISTFGAVGKGVGESLIDMVARVFRSKDKAPNLFNLIGVGLGDTLINDMRDTEGKDATINTVLTNATTNVLQHSAEKKSGWRRFVDKVGSTVSSIFGKGGPESSSAPDEKVKLEPEENDNWGTGPVKPMSQKDPRWNQRSDSMARTGCGPTAAAMVASAYGAKDANPAEANKRSYGMGMRAPDGGTNPAFFSKYASAHGYGMTEGPVSSKSVSSNLDKGRPVVMMGKGGAFGGNMHYLVADKVTGKGDVGIVDPLTGGRKTTKMGDLLGNTKSAVYSYGKGPVSAEDGSEELTQSEVNSELDAVKADDSVETTDGRVSPSEAQQALVNKMASIIGTIRYSTKAAQDPDQGTASCASTVGWAYRKTIPATGDPWMSASSSDQSKDGRFTTIYVKKNKNDEVPLDILQPGDIMYQRVSKSGDKWGNYTYDDLVKENPGKPLGHTEMYAGNGKDLSHGGNPEYGPVYKDLGEYRRLRTFMVRRYTPFVNGEDIDIDTANYMNNTTASNSGNTGSSSSGMETTSASSVYSSGPDGYTGEKSSSGGGITGLEMFSALSSMFSNISSKLGNVLSVLMGGTVEHEDGENPYGFSNNGTDSDTRDAASTNSTDSTPSTKADSTGIAYTGDIDDPNPANAPQVPSTDTTATVWNYLRGKGFTPEITAGIMGNLEAESGIDPYNVQNGLYRKRLGVSISNAEEDKKYLSDVESGSHDFVNDSIGYGLAQWTYYDRKQKLKELADADNKPISDLGIQLKHLWNELNARGHVEQLNGTSTVKDASNIILHKFEQPADQSPAVENLRASYGQAWYDKYINEETTAKKEEPAEAEVPEETGESSATKAPELSPNDSNYEEEYGAGPGMNFNLEMMNNKIQNLNRLMEDTREEAESESTVAAVTNRITDAIGMSKGGSDAQSKALEAITATLGTMVEYLAKIADNTSKMGTAAPVNENSNVTDINRKYSRIPAASPVYPSGDGSASDVGAAIADRLTSI